MSDLSQLREYQGLSMKNLIRERNHRLVGVNVFWIGTTKGTFTDANGKFQIGKAGIRDYRLVLSLLGYQRDTITVAKRQP